MIHKLCNPHITIDRIREDLTFLRLRFSHLSSEFSFSCLVADFLSCLQRLLRVIYSTLNVINLYLTPITKTNYKFQILTSSLTAGLFLTFPCSLSCRSGSWLRALSSIFRTTLRTSRHTRCIEGATNNMIANTRQIFHTPTAHHDDGVLLQIVPFTRDIGVNLLVVGQANTSNFTHRRIRFFRRGRVDTHTYPSSLRTGIQSRRLALHGE